MVIESKEVIMKIRKGVMLSIKASCRSAYGHPYITGMLLYLLILYSDFPSLFAFLLSSSPVIVCTAMLLGVLLSYGTPNVPEIEEEEDDKTTREISSLQVGGIVDDLVVKKDESFTAETHLTTDTTELNERATEEAVLVEPSNFEGNHEKNIVSIESELNVSDEREVHDHVGFVEEREFPSENRDQVPINDQKEVEGLTVRIAETVAADNPFDSSLGSPWQPVDSDDISSGSESDGAESSSPDASMADIIPMLDELHPLLESEHPHILRVTKDSDSSSTSSSSSSSSELSQDHKSDDGIAEDDDVVNKEDTEKELEGSNSDVAVTWTADDQKNVMDLGISELERNRRLESLIAKRRLRKLQRMETEKNLIDLDIYYPSIPSISAPRRNPFDLPDVDSNYPPVPSSAPSILQPRQNPFDLPYEHRKEEKISSILSRDYLSHSDFVSVSRTDPSLTAVWASFSGDLDEEKSGSNLKTEISSIERQMSENSDSKICSDFEFDMISPFTGQQEDQNRLIEPEIIGQESKLSSKIDTDVEHVEEQDSQSFQQVIDADQHEESGLDVGYNNHAIDLYTSADIGETHQAAVASAVGEDEIGELNNLADFDTEKGQAIEESTNTETNEKSCDVDAQEESINIEQTRDASDPIYDSSPSAIGETLSNIDRSKSIESELGSSSLLSSSEDPELTVYNANKLHVLEACFFEELDSVFKRPQEEAAVLPPTSDLTYENSVELDNVNEKQELTGTDTELVVLEAKSVEDINSVLKGLSEAGLVESIDTDLVVLEAKSVDDISSALKGLREEGLHKSSISDIEPSEVQVQPEGYKFEPEETNSNFHVVDAKNLEDINLAMKQLSDGNVERLQEEMEHTAEASQRHLEPEGFEVHSLEASEHVEIQSAQEIELDSKEAATAQTMIAGQSSESFDASTSASSKIVKGNFGNSSSSSSSDSSSSTSDSE